MVYLFELYAVEQKKQHRERKECGETHNLLKIIIIILQCSSLGSEVFPSPSGDLEGLRPEGGEMNKDKGNRVEILFLIFEIYLGYQ